MSGWPTPTDPGRRCRWCRRDLYGGYPYVNVSYDGGPIVRVCDDCAAEYEDAPGGPLAAGLGPDGADRPDDDMLWGMPL